MEKFQVNSFCPLCGYGAEPDKESNKITPCKAKATDVPLRCEHCADPAEIAAWPQELYHLKGEVYLPVTKMIQVPYQVPVEKPLADPQPDGPTTEIVMEDRVRDEKVVDEEATLAAGPATPPKTIAHVHRQCLLCGTEWVEGI